MAYDLINDRQLRIISLLDEVLNSILSCLRVLTEAVALS